jgi:hypothetical protein
LDTIKLANGEAEWEVVARTRKADYMFIGHLHRPIGTWRGIPLHIQRALTDHVPFEFEAGDYIAGTLEAPDYALATVVNGNNRHPLMLVCLRQAGLLAAWPKHAGQLSWLRVSRGYRSRRHCNETVLTD